MTDPRTLTPRWPTPELLIGGKSVPAAEGGTLRVSNPATGETLLEVSAAGPRDVDAVFLTGGSSFVPAVRRIFDVRFGADRVRSGNEFTSVARGLALGGTTSRDR